MNEVWVSEAFDPSIIGTGREPQKSRYQALWDTGATNTCITRRIAIKLGLRPSGKAEVSGVHGSKVVSTSAMTLGRQNTVTICGIRATEAEISDDRDVRIGMDVIRDGDLAISNSNNRTIFSFRVPPIEEIDFRKEIEEDLRKATPQTPDE